jgi:hypothetical protein
MNEGFRFQQDGPYRWVTNDLRVLFLIGPKTGHAWHAESKAESEAFIAQALKSADKTPSHLRFVTYTTRFNRSYWLDVDGLEETYRRGEVDAKRSEDGRRFAVTTKNIDGIRFEASDAMFTIDGHRLKAGVNPSFEKTNGKWTLASRGPDASRNDGQGSGGPASARALRKIHGLQGPVDDAFVDAFVCVRPTGTPWHPVVQEWATKTLETFAVNFAKWLRGDVRVKDDRAIVASDIAAYHLVLFGDPGSNSVIARIVGKLPVRWSKTEIAVGAQKFAPSDHIPVLIYPNPLNPKRYVVINSGHTFGDADFRGTNAWLYPRLGDYAVLTATGDVALSGFFDESWRLK